MTVSTMNSQQIIFEKKKIKIIYGISYVQEKGMERCDKVQTIFFLQILIASGLKLTYVNP